MDRTRPPRADAAAPRPLNKMGFVDSLRAKLPGGKDDGKPKKKTAKEIFAEAQKARKRGEPIPRGEGLGGEKLPDLPTVPGEDESSVISRPQPKPERCR